MAKELVISSNRHETKVAMLEDDQLVELFFQRTKEYSLAGSIHKGRVTRVLPGMQSAFVDLGLERDTFLYVSDFFDESEEYEKLPAAGEERGRRDRDRDRDRERDRDRGREREAPPAWQAAPSSAPLPAERGPEEPEEAPVEEAAAPHRAGPAFAPPERPMDDDRDRRGRRSRRRRGRGRGFPDSKYASDFPDRGERDAGPGPDAEAMPDEEPLLLPGESLAKYSRFEPPREADGEIEAGDAEEMDRATSGFEEDVAVEPEEEPVVEATTEEPEDESEAAPQLVAELSDGIEPDADAAGEEPVEDLPEAEDESAIEDSSPDFGAEAELEAESLEADAVEELPGEDEPGEPVKEPLPEIAADEELLPGQPAVASIREQGGRYMHRGSRRMRRRTRGGERGPEPSGLRPDGGRSMSRPDRERGVERERGPERERGVERERGQERERGPERPAERKDEKPQPSITELLKEGQEILVQIAKEPLGQKGARITSHIALPGRYCVYMPTVEHMGVSRKIASDEERSRLRRILQTHRVGIPGGYIVRTAGEGKTEEQIASDMAYLYNLWLDIRQKAEHRPAPALIYHDVEIVQRILRDQLTDSFKAIWVDHEEIYESVLRFVQRFQPGLVGKVKLYTRQTPIFDAFTVTQELEKALRPKVWLKSGGYIVINQTEALVAIDVNTGKFVGKSNRLEDTIVKTNTDAVKEIVRQIRLRDLGGIIVVDFIDMDERKNRQKVMQALEEAMRADRAPYKILQFNDFGLVAITRKRVKQSLERTLCSPCPHCEGAGYIKSVQTIIGEIIVEAQKIAKAVDGKEVLLRVHPDVAVALKSTANHYLEELEETLGRPVLVTSDATLHQEKFDLA